MENYKNFIFNKFFIKFRDDILKYITLFVLLFVVILIFTFLIFNYADAATNIDATYKYAWNDVIGWIDFYSTGNVNVSSTQLTGYATSSVGFIALDCATSPSPPAGCSTTFSNWKVTNDGAVILPVGLTTTPSVGLVLTAEPPVPAMLIRLPSILQPEIFPAGLGMILSAGSVLIVFNPIFAPLLITKSKLAGLF